LLLDGSDPYDSDRLVPMQRSMYDGVNKAIMMWNPNLGIPHRAAICGVALPDRTTLLAGPSVGRDPVQR